MLGANISLVQFNLYNYQYSNTDSFHVPWVCNGDVPQSRSEYHIRKLYPYTTDRTSRKTIYAVNSS